MASTVSLNETVLFILSFLIIIFYFKVYKNDTSVESIFFTIDTSRTMRFMIAYMFALNIGIIGIYIVLPFLVFGLVVSLVLILFLAANLLIFIFNLLLFLVGPQISFIAIDSLFSLSQTNIIHFFENYFILGIFALQLLFSVLPPIFAGRQIGKYAEDSKSIAIIGMTWYLFLVSLSYIFRVFNFQDPGVILLDLAELVILLDFGLFYYIARASYSNKLMIDNYDLLEIRGIRFYIYLIMGLIPLMLALGFVLLLLMLEFTKINADGFINFLLLTWSIVIDTIFAIFIFLFYMRGDHPVQQKIAELEMREELLEMAKEFRDLDPTNIDDFVRTSGSKI